MPIALDVWDSFPVITMFGGSANRGKRLDEAIFGHKISYPIPISSARKIAQDSVRSDLDTYVNVNNHYEGCAPLTIERLLAAMKG